MSNLKHVVDSAIESGASKEEVIAIIEGEIANTMGLTPDGVGANGELLKKFLELFQQLLPIILPLILKDQAPS